MKAEAPCRPDGLTAENWDRAPFNRWSFQHVSDLLATVPVPCGSAPASPLVSRPQGFSALPFALDEERHTIGSWLDASFTDGFMVISRGEVLTEEYRNGMGPASLHLLQSVSKSVTAAAAGVMIGQGLLDPEAPVSTYLPELEETAWRGALLRHVLDMTSGVFFDETYTATDSHCAWLDAAAGWKPHGASHWPRTVFDLVKSLKQKDFPHGHSFRYRSIETDVLALCMERAGKAPLADLLSSHVWAPMGAETEARFTVDSAGLAGSDGGLNTSLRDLGRFALMMARGGRVNGRQVVPAAWIEDCLKGDPALFGPENRHVLPKGAYRNQFWLEEAGRPVLICRGVFGQIVYIDMDADFAAVKFSTWPDFVDPQATRRALAAIRAIRDCLR